MPFVDKLSDISTNSLFPKLAPLCTNPRFPSMVKDSAVILFDFNEIGSFGLHLVVIVGINIRVIGCHFHAIGAFRLHRGVIGCHFHEIASARDQIAVSAQRMALIGGHFSFDF